MMENNQRNDMPAQYMCHRNNEWVLVDDKELLECKGQTVIECGHFYDLMSRTEERNKKPSLHLCHRKNKWVVVDDKELLKSKGLTVTEWGHDWSLERQQQYAVRYGMCPRICDVLGGEQRICGKSMKNDGKNRKNCSRCTITYSEVPKERASKSHQTVGCNAVSSSVICTSEPLVSPPQLVEPRCVQSVGCNTVSSSVTGTSEPLVSCPQLVEPRRLYEKRGPIISVPHKIETLREVYKRRYDHSMASTTRANAKSGLKIFMELHNLTLDSPAVKFTRIFTECEDLAALMTKINGLPSKHNMRRAIMAILRVLDCEREYKFVSEWVQSNAPSREVQKQIKPKPAAQMEKLAAHLHVNLKESSQPGADLLEAAQETILHYIPHDELERKFYFRHLLAWWIPAARNNGEDLTVHKGFVSDYENTTAHQVCVNAKGEVIGIFFGNLKFTTTARYQHLWRKRFMLTAKGIKLFNEPEKLPQHMNMDEYEMWWRMLAVTCEDQMKTVGSRHGTKLFPADSVSPIEEQVFGLSTGSCLYRVVFRNAFKEVDEFFIRYVMQHTPNVDDLAYVKPRLMSGPW